MYNYKNRFQGKTYTRALKHGYRSGLEQVTAKQLKDAGVDFTYEKLKIKFVQPETNRTYTPDFVLENGIIIETKGQFSSDDRKKMLLVKAQHPDLDIRFVFSYAGGKIYKGSKTTNAKWAFTHGFKWANKKIPTEWLKEPKKEIKL